MVRARVRGPVALLGTRRSVAAIPLDAFGKATVYRFDGAQPHNPREIVNQAGAFVDDHRCASVVAIGSSSAIDLGKAVSDGRDVLLALVPTALGGAEMSRGYGVVEGDRKAGGRLRSPAPIVVYDATLLGSLPRASSARSGSTRWAHTIEAAYARTQHALGTAAAIVPGECCPDCCCAQRHARDDALHRALFEAAHLAGFALDTRSMGLHHAVCHVDRRDDAHPARHRQRDRAAARDPRKPTDRVRRGAAVAAAFAIDDLAAQSEASRPAYGLPRSFAELGAPPDVPDRALPLVMEQPLLRNNPALPDAQAVRDLLAAAYGPAA